MSKTAIPYATRGNLFHVAPEKLFLVTDPKDELYDERVHNKPEENKVNVIKKFGIKPPIQVVKRSAENADGFVLAVVDGRQRTINACEANKQLKKSGDEALVKVPVVLVEKNAGFSTMIITNEMTLADEPMNKARKAVTARTRGLSDEEVAQMFNVTVVQIKQWYRVVDDVCDAVQKAVEKGEIAISTAAQLADLNENEQVQQLHDLKTQGIKPTRENVKQAVAAKKDKSGKKAVKKPSPKQLKEYIKDENTPDDARDVLKWVLGETKTRPW